MNKVLLAVALLLMLPQHVTYPNRALTPGLTVELSTAVVCKTQWGRDVRHVTPKMKRQVCAAYGIVRGCPGAAWELDHLVPRELGGADDVNNLWPEPIGEARKKDRVENYLHREVCAGRMPLADAQERIKEDWYSVYESLPQR